MFTLTDIQTLAGIIPYMWTACLYVLAVYLLTEASPLHIHHFNNLIDHHARNKSLWRNY